MKRFMVLTFCFLTVLTLSLGQTSVAAGKRKIRVGVMLWGVIGDHGWTYQHNQARLELEKEPYISEVKFAENVQTEGGHRVVREFVKQKFDLIIGSDFGWTEVYISVSNRHPKIAFENAGAYKLGKNMGSFFGRMYEAYYLTGMTAGMMTKTNKVGFAAAHPIPYVLRGMNAFALGVKSVNPKAKIHALFTNAWYDPAKEAEAAKALLAQGADVIAQWQDSPAGQQAAEAAGKYSIGHNASMHKFAPKGHLTDSVYNWGTFYKWAARQVYNGTWKAMDKWWGLKENAVDISPFGKVVPQRVRDRVLAMKAKIKSGEFHPFTGPIKNQSGKVVIAAGERASKAKLYKTDYLVDSIVGQIPKKK